MVVTKIVSRAFSSASENTIKHVTVIGAGLMGSGIAQVTAQAGLNATIVDVSQEALKKSDANINASIQRVGKKLYKDNAEEKEKFISESLARIKMTTELNKTVENTDLVIEAVVENLELKQKLFAHIDPVAQKHTLFSSNTSSLSIADIAKLTKRLDRFGGLHFFNPVPVMKLLEVIRIPETTDETYEKMMAYGKHIGKTTITCNDTPGFVVNRLLVPNLAEAIRMVERGVTTTRDIDIAMKLGAGHPMGPFELADYTGIDTFKFILDGWHKRFPDNPLFKPTETANKLVAEGKLGTKSGEGFYSYNKDKK